jgi:hypothetical protein
VFVLDLPMPRRRAIVAIPVVLILLVTLVACGAEDKTTQPLNANNASQGKLIWDDSDPESPAWRLQCASPTDFKWLTSETLKEIKADTGLRIFCEEAAKVLTLPNPFTVKKADLEIDTFLKAMPKYKICSSNFRYRMGLLAELEAQTAYESAVLRKELGDYLGGSLDLNEAMEFQSTAEIYKWTHEESAVKISKTPAGGICGEIQF